MSKQGLYRNTANFVLCIKTMRRTLGQLFLLQMVNKVRRTQNLLQAVLFFRFCIDLHTPNLPSEIFKQIALRSKLMKKTFTKS